MRKEFYQKVLPAQGVYCATGIDKNKKITNQFAETLSDLFDVINQLEETQQNVFVALSSFSAHSRKSDYAAFSKSFFVDLDVGEGANKYPDKSAALMALMGFCDTVQLPPPVIVDSGNGIHAYWIFERDIQIDEWRLYADKFKKFCLANGLLIDPVVTADVSRIMRCPETVNYKREPYAKTQFITEDILEYDFDLFKEFLGPVEVPLKSLLTDVPKGLDDDTKAMLGFDNFQTTFQSIAERSLSGEGCRQIAYILTNSASLPEPLWHSGLSIARHCEDWETAIHLMSEDYPGYSAEHTLRKANETLNKPHSCAVIESRNPGGCDGCPLRGRVTNPLAIGRQLKTVPPQDSPPDPVRLATDTKAVPDFPQFLLPFVRGVNGGIYYVPPDEEDDDGNSVKGEPIMISPHTFFPFRRTFNQAEGECYEVRIVMPHEVRELVLPTKAMSKLEDFKNVLGKQGLVPLDQKLWPLMVGYMTKWALHFQSQDAAEHTRMQMGWTEDYSSFVIGNSEVTRNKGIQRSAASPLVRAIAKHLSPAGSYDVWKTATQKLNLPGMEMYVYGMLNSFGSPLMRFTSTSGVTVCYVGDSGNGKTGILYAGLSVFGSPKELSIHDSTDNALLMRALNLKNIMLGVDEVGNRSAEEMSKLIHAISQGKGKARMQSSVDAERETSLTASMICSMTTNHSIIEKLTLIKANPNGEVARLMEFPLRLPKIMVEKPHLGPEIFDTMRLNYGHAGPEYIQYLMRVGDGYIKKLIEKWLRKFTASAFGTSTAYRFYENGIACAFAGGELAQEAGIVDFDLDHVFNYVVMELLKIRENTVKINDVDYAALVSEYIDRYWHNILMLDNGRVISEPRASIMGRVELEEETFFVSKTEFKKFLAEKTVGLGEFDEGMRIAGIKIQLKKMRLSTGWKSAMGVAAPIMVYAIRSNIPQAKLDAAKSPRA
jgi:hypothetical protein